MIRAGTLTTIKPKTETPQSPLSPDIAQIIGQAIIEAGRNSDKLTLSIANALQSLLPKPAIPAIEKAVASVEVAPYSTPYNPLSTEHNPPLPAKQLTPSSWVFKIARDQDGDMTAIKATSPTSFWDFNIVREQNGSMAKIKAVSPDSSWEFKVIRDSNGNMASIKATSK